MTDQADREPSRERDVARRDWVGRLLERLSRQPSQSGSNEQPPRFTPPLLLALLALAAAAGVTIGLIITSRGDETELEATRMTLELTYPTTGNPTANLEGQMNAAPAGARITCRATSDERRLGEGRATGDGAFDIALAAATWPLDDISGDAYQALNTTLECRAGTGPWTQPLRPPRVAIN
ncbi:MAG: hypothetical protein M3439_10640 [Chloroflexota bacterium]|nr:hypothetical protein [Chloroflexota bacterium]